MTNRKIEKSEEKKRSDLYGLWTIAKTLSKFYIRNFDVTNFFPHCISKICVPNILFNVHIY